MLQKRFLPDFQPKFEDEMRQSMSLAQPKSSSYFQLFWDLFFLKNLQELSNTKIIGLAPNEYLHVFWFTQPADPLYLPNEAGGLGAHTAVS